MSAPIKSASLFSNEGFPIPIAFSAGTTQRISVVNGPAYVTLESKHCSLTFLFSFNPVLQTPFKSPQKSYTIESCLLP